MIIVSDIGNTNIVFALFESNNDNPLSVFRISTKNSKTSDEYCAEIFIQLNLINVNIVDINGGIIASVVPSLIGVLRKSFEKLFNFSPYIFTYNSNSGLNISYKTPETLGIDRLLNTSFVWLKYNKSSIVIDSGTATTVDIVIAGDFIGGMILPGFNLMKNSLFSNTEMLPSIDIKDIDFIIGKNTIESIQSGIINGYFHLLNGLINDIKVEYPNIDFDIWITGGFSEFLKKRFSNAKFDVDLTLKA
ncbi:type III pantothenate kinase, partial [bacterium]|nr:type III pantothenate kinase [bacterium]